MSSNVKGMAQVNANLRKLIQTLGKDAKKGLEDCALDLERRAQQLAPIDSGDLRGSSSVEITTAFDKPTATVSFNTPYALRMHEDMSYTAKEPGTGQKYLENPLNENGKRYASRIKQSVKEGLK
jgi:hypothetical protein